MDGLYKRVKVYTYEIDQRDFMCRYLLHVFRVVADGKQASCNSRTQGFHPPIQDLGKSRQVGYLAHRNTVGTQQPRCTSGRNDFDFEAGQHLRKFDDSGFVIHADQRAFNSSHEISKFGVRRVNSLFSNQRFHKENREFTRLTPNYFRSPFTVFQIRYQTFATSVTACEYAMEAIPN